jgi:hypothetical protein
MSCVEVREAESSLSWTCTTYNSITLIEFHVEGADLIQSLRFVLMVVFLYMDQCNLFRLVTIDTFLCDSVFRPQESATSPSSTFESLIMNLTNTLAISILRDAHFTPKVVCFGSRGCLIPIDRSPHIQAADIWGFTRFGR